MTADNLPVPADAPGPAPARYADMFARSARSKNTEDARRRDLIGAALARTPAWLPWCAAHGIDPLGQARPAHLLAWVADLKAAGDSESTRNRRLSTVSAWYRYLLREEVVQGNPADGLDPGEKPQSAKKIYARSPTAAPSRSQAQAMQQVADEDGPHASATISLLENTGARVSELCAADVEDIGSDRGHPVLSLIGKGGKVRMVPLPPAVFRRVQAMIEARTADADRLPVAAAGARPRRPLLVQARRGGRMTRHDVARVLTRIARKAGVPVHLTPHGMRGAFITDLLDEGVPIYDVQRVVGHATTEVTDRYNAGDLNPDRNPVYRRAAQLADDRRGQPDPPVGIDL